jgi:hypothetical protein
MKLNKIFIVILFSASQLLAQDIGTTEVRVVEGFKPTISEASRLNEKAAFADTIKKVRTQEYAVIATDLKSDYKTRPLKAAKVKADKIAQLYGTKVSVGFGNAWTTKASIVHNSKRSKILSYGIIANHFANKYELPYYTDPDAPHLAIVVYPYQVKNSKNTMHLYGKKMSASHIFMGNLDYDRRTALYRNTNPALLSEENLRNRFAYTKLSFSAVSKELAADKLKHHTTFFVSDLNEFSENQIHLSTNLSKTIKDLPFALEIELNDYLNYNNSDYTGEDVKSVQSFHFSPSTSLTKYGIDFDLGIEFHYLSDDTPFEIFPQIRATKELVKDVLLVFGGLRHSEQRHTLKSLSDENPYIHSYGTNQTILGGNVVTQDLKTTDTDELYVAMRNVLGKGEVFEGSVAYGTVQNLAHFVGVANGTYNRFLVDYIDVKQLHVNASYDRKINNIISVKANADYYNWDKEVYYKPNFTCDISTPINLRNKIKVTPSLSYIGKRKTNSSFDSEPVFLPVIVEELPSQFHMNLGVYYNYTKNISAYLQLNNLTNSKQDMWIGYREVGFNGLFGLNYSF